MGCRIAGTVRRAVMADRRARHTDISREPGTGKQAVSNEPGGQPEELLPNQPTAEEGALKRTAKQFQADNLADWAAALTYYGVLSLFPGLLLLISGLRLAGNDTPRRVIENLTSFAPGGVR